MKKQYADGIIHIAILLSLLRTDVNQYFNSIDSPEITEIILGQSLAYSQTQFHSPSFLNRYSEHIISPKAVDNDYFVNSIMRDLRSLNHNPYSRAIRVHGNHLHVDAWLVSDITQAGSRVRQPTVDDNEASEATTASDSISQQPSESTSGAVEIVQPSTSIDTVSDLTKEEMDLIEILWQQDIDLGVTRDAFDVGLRKEMEKTHPLEGSHEKVFTSPDEVNVEKEDNDTPSRFSIDDETGEWITTFGDEVGPLLSIPDSNTESVPLQPQDNLDAAFDIDEAMEELQRQLTTPEGTNTEYRSTSQLPLLDEGIEFDSAGESLVNFDNVLPFGDNPFPEQDGLLTTPDVMAMNNLNHTLSSMLSMPMNNLNENSSMYQRQSSLEQRFQDLTAVLLSDVNHTNDTEMFHESLSPSQEQKGGTSLLPEFNSSLPSSTNGTDFDLSPNDVLFPNMTSLNEQTNETLMELLRPDSFDLEKLNDMDIDGGTDFDVRRPRQTSMSTTASESSGDSAVCLSSLSSPSRDTDDGYERNHSPYDGLIGATGGTYQTSHPISKSSDDYYDSDGCYSDVCRSPHGNSLNISTSSNDTGRWSPEDRARHVSHNHTYHTPPGQLPREVKQYAKKEKDKTKENRDSKRVKAMKLPYTVEEIVEMPVDDLNEILRGKTLNEGQIQAIKDIRRRGKNKVAAQHCRKRKMDEIDHLQAEVDKIQTESQTLQSERHSLENEIASMRKKYSTLYDSVFKTLKDSGGNPYNPDQYSLQMMPDGGWVMMPRNTTSIEHNETKQVESDPKKKTRSKRKK